MSNKEIAAALFLSPKTVEHHLSSVYRKRGFRSRAELAGIIPYARGRLTRAAIRATRLMKFPLEGAWLGGVRWRTRTRIH
jgi:hypothetical protein